MLICTHRITSVQRIPELETMMRYGLARGSIWLFTGVLAHVWNSLGEITWINDSNSTV
jgi:hypothetical protein